MLYYEILPYLKIFLFFYFLDSGLYLVVLRTYTWLCAQGPLLVGFEEPYEVWGLNPSWLHIRKYALFLLYRTDFAFLNGIFPVALISTHLGTSNLIFRVLCSIQFLYICVDAIELLRNCFFSAFLVLPLVEKFKT